MCDGILAHSTWKWDLVEGMGSLDNTVISHLPSEQAAACFGTLFYTLSVRGRVAKSLRTTHGDEHKHLIDGVRHAYLKEDSAGPEI